MAKQAGTEGFYMEGGKKQDVACHKEALDYQLDAEDQAAVLAELKASGASQELIDSYFKGPTKMQLAMAKEIG